MTLELRDVSKSFTTGAAVSDLSFEVRSGSVFGLLGPNGAGKTTTIRMILDIIRPDRGEILWDATPAQALPRSSIGYLPEERGLYADMKVADQLAFFGELSGLDRAEARARADRWLTRMDIAEHADKPVAALSKGNQQKVQLLATLAHDPPLLVLDEPFAGLDPVNNELLRDVVGELREAGSTLIISTHDMEQVESLCDHVALMHRSRLVFAASVGELRARHRDRRYLRLVFSGDEDALTRALHDVEPDGREDGWTAFRVGNGATPEDVLREAMGVGRVRELRTVEPSMREIFLSEIGHGR